MDKVEDIRDDFNPFLDPAIWHQLIDGRMMQIRALMEASRGR